MENQLPPSPPQQPQYIVVKTNKSVGLALLLTFLFGPLGLLYATVSGALIMLFISLIVAFITFGFGILITWPICMIWAAIAVNNQNNRMRPR